LYPTTKVGGVDAAFLMNPDLPPLGGIRRATNKDHYLVWHSNDAANNGDMVRRCQVNCGEDGFTGGGCMQCGRRLMTGRSMVVVDN
jgi:hypothetical protein